MNIHNKPMILIRREFVGGTNHLGTLKNLVPIGKYEEDLFMQSNDLKDVSFSIFKTSLFQGE